MPYFPVWILQSKPKNVGSMLWYFNVVRRVSAVSRVQELTDSSITCYRSHKSLLFVARDRIGRNIKHVQHVGVCQVLGHFGDWAECSDLGFHRGNGLISSFTAVNGFLAKGFDGFAWGGIGCGLQLPYQLQVKNTGLVVWRAGGAGNRAIRDFRLCA